MFKLFIHCQLAPLPSNKLLSWGMEVLYDEGPGQDCLTCSPKLLGELGAIVKGP